MSWCNLHHIICELVGAVGFELTTPCAQGRCATRLRYAPTFAASLILNHFLNFRYRPVLLLLSREPQKTFPLRWGPHERRIEMPYGAARSASFEWAFVAAAAPIKCTQISWK